MVYVEPLPEFMKKNDAGTPGYDRATAQIAPRMAWQGRAITRESREAAIPSIVPKPIQRKALSAVENG